MLLSLRTVVALSIASLVAVDVGVAGCGTSSFTGEGSDGGSDASADDAQTLDGSGGGDASSGDAAPFCAGFPHPPYFCADFDQASYQAAFQQGSPQNLFDAFVDGGTLGTAPSDDSLPNELLVSIPVMDAGARAQVTTGARIFDATGATTFHFDLDFKINSPAAPSSGVAQTLFELELDDRGDIEAHHYPCQIVSGALNVSVDGLENLPFGSVPPSGVWVHAHYDVDLRPPASFKAKINGVPVTATGNPANSISTAPTVTLGLSTAGPSDAVSVSFDNVTLSVEALDAG